MSDDEDRMPEPNTIPPPNGAKDMYSAPTRIGTLPEEVLAAMRAEATDATVAARASVMEFAAHERLRPPEPAALEEPVIDPMLESYTVIVQPETQSRSSLVRSLILVAVFAGLGALVAAAITLW